MQKTAWKTAAKDSADRPRAEHFFEMLAATDAAGQLENFSGRQLRLLAALFAGSQFLGDLLVAHPDWLPTLDPDRI